MPSKQTHAVVLEYISGFNLFKGNYVSALCSHFKSFLYFAESINNSSIEATKCDSWEHFKEGLCDTNEKATFGEHYQLGPTGKFYLYFNSSLKP